MLLTITVLDKDSDHQSKELDVLDTGSFKSSKCNVQTYRMDKNMVMLMLLDLFNFNISVLEFRWGKTYHNSSWNCDFRKKNGDHLMEVSQTFYFTLCFLLCLSNVRALACFCFCCCRYTMYMLVRMSEHVINNQHMGSFLGKTFGNCLIKVKRGFDKCVVSSGRV